MYYDVVCLGEILIDFKVDEKNTYHRNPGGAPLNVCATMAKYNCKTTIIGKVGNDDLGKYLKQSLDNLSIDSSNLVFDNDHITTQAFITTDKSGERYFSFKRENTADLFLNKHDINFNIFKNAKIFHFGSLSLVNSSYQRATLESISKAKENNCIISFDPNYREMLWKNKMLAIKKITKVLPLVDIIKLSSEEAQLITKTTSNIAALKELEKYKIPVILLTDGKNGAMVKYKQIIGNVKAPKVTPIDTTGAGDIFLGTFLTMIAKYAKPIDSLSYDELLSYTKRACKQASLSTQKEGAINSIPEFQ